MNRISNSKSGIYISTKRQEKKAIHLVQKIQGI